MDANKTVKELKAIAKERGIKGFSQMRKAELFNVLSNEEGRSESILDEFVPEVTKYVKTKVSSLKSLASSRVSSITRSVNKFADWIWSYVPEPMKKPIHERGEKLKQKVNRIHKEIESFIPHQRKTAFGGYLRDYKIDGKDGYGPKSFSITIKESCFSHE